VRPPSVATVRLVVVATILLTAIHFTDNFIAVETYPRPDWLSETAVRVGAVVSWPLFATFGLAGYIFYRRGRFDLAHPFLFAFSYLGLVSLGHFLSASPDELTTRGLVSVLIDAVMGSTVVAVTLLSILARRRQPAATARSTAG
jgi:hypothetical protein